MNKKRREFVNCEVLNYNGSETSVSQLIAVQTNSEDDGRVIRSQHQILPKFGLGCIINFKFDNIQLSISRYKLVKDLVIFCQCETDFIELSFLLEGEKIISLDDCIDDVLLESQESYIANIKNFKGFLRISGAKAYKEIKIKFPKTFFKDRGFTNNFAFKKISEKNLVLPITSELFSVLTDLEDISLKGISRKLFMEAKVLELLAIQIENYNNNIVNARKFATIKSIKKIYAVEQILKDNLHQNFSTKQLSREVALNENSLKCEFKRLFGCSMNEYSKEEKMNKAKELLENTSTPIYQIAENTGYKNATHFSAAFKKYFGETPMQFRNKLK